ncbi:MAG: murein hydrolase activator EnvC family protein [Sulfobacillus sp.]
MDTPSYRLVVLSERDGTSQELSFGMGLHTLVLAASVFCAVAVSVAMLFFAAYLGTARANQLAAAHIAALHQLVTTEQQQKMGYLADEQSVAQISTSLSTLEQAVTSAESRVSAIDGYGTPAIAGFQTLISALQQLTGQLGSQSATAVALSWPRQLPVAGKVTAGYGWHSASTGSQFSPGVQIQATPGAPVLAVAAGTVASISPSAQGGNTVVVASPGGLQVAYAQLNTPRVRVGQTVQQGQTLATAGKSAIGFTVWVWGQSQNPLSVIRSVPVPGSL